MFSDGAVCDSCCPGHLFQFPVSSTAFHVKVAWRGTNCLSGGLGSPFDSAWLYSFKPMTVSLGLKCLCFFQQRFTNTYLQCDEFSGGLYGRYKAVLNMALAPKEPTDS